jgi:hypothetical protein
LPLPNNVSLCDDKPQPSRLSGDLSDAIPAAMGNVKNIKELRKRLNVDRLIVREVSTKAGRWVLKD